MGPGKRPKNEYVGVFFSSPPRPNPNEISPVLPAILDILDVNFSSARISAAPATEKVREPLGTPPPQPETIANVPGANPDGVFPRGTDIFDDHSLYRDGAAAFGRLIEHQRAPFFFNRTR